MPAFFTHQAAFSVPALEYTLVLLLQKTDSIYLEYKCPNCEETSLDEVCMNNKTVEELRNWVKRVRVPSVSRVIGMKQRVEKGQMLFLTSKKLRRCDFCSIPRKPRKEESTYQSQEWDPEQFAVFGYSSEFSRCKFIPERLKQLALCYRPCVGDPSPTASDELPHLLHEELKKAKTRGAFVLSYRYHGPQFGFSYRLHKGLPGYVKN